MSLGFRALRCVVSWCYHEPGVGADGFSVVMAKSQWPMSFLQPHGLKPCSSVHPPGTVFLSSITDYSVFSSQQAQEETDMSSQDDMEQSLLMMPEARSAPQSNTALWKKQVSTIAKLHFLSLKRESKCVRVM